MKKEIRKKSGLVITYDDPTNTHFAENKHNERSVSYTPTQYVISKYDEITNLNKIRQQILYRRDENRQICLNELLDILNIKFKDSYISTYNQNIVISKVKSIGLEIYPDFPAVGYWLSSNKFIVYKRELLTIDSNSNDYNHLMAFVYSATMLIKHYPLDVEKRFIIDYINNVGLNSHSIEFFKLKLDCLLLYHKKENWKACIEPLSYTIRDNILIALTKLCLIKESIGVQLITLKRIFVDFKISGSNVDGYIKAIKSDGERVLLQNNNREYARRANSKLVKLQSSTSKFDHRPHKQAIASKCSTTELLTTNNTPRKVPKFNDADSYNYSLQSNDLGYGIRFYSPLSSRDYILPYEYGSIADIYEDDIAIFAEIDGSKKNTASEILENSEAKAMFCLDLEKLTQLEQETKESHRMLAEVFGEDDDEDTIEEIISATNPAIELLKTLLEKDCWARAEVEQLCQSRGVMLGAMLEQINDYAYGKIDDAVIEDDGDEIYVTTEYKDKLL